jgi:23S rRNA (cytidine1920-2'-O)/16S rRNA (cytidine1409-2'-O)-methyltransferase
VGTHLSDQRPPERRLDVALSERGIARSRTHAARLIADGSVTVDGQTVIKPSVRVTDDQVLAVRNIDHYVSRAAHKLLAALDAFPVEVAGKEAVDVGASTGGFTQVLLERGASSVVALDVGHGQLDRILAIDKRVTVIEGFNARDLTSAGLDAAAKREVRAEVVVGDLSFISLTTVLPAIVTTVGPHADYLFLIKPQFEVGRTGIREGIVRDPGLRVEAVGAVLWAAWDLGLKTAGLISSPILGTAGNHEYLAWLSAGTGSNPTEWTDRVFGAGRSPKFE